MPASTRSSRPRSEPQARAVARGAVLRGRCHRTSTATAPATLCALKASTPGLDHADPLGRELLAAMSLFAGNVFGRWFGIIAASLVALGSILANAGPNGSRPRDGELRVPTTPARQPDRLQGGPRVGRRVKRARVYKPTAPPRSSLEQPSADEPTRPSRGPQPHGLDRAWRSTAAVVRRRARTAAIEAR